MKPSRRLPPLTGARLEWFCTNYAHTTNAEICQHLGISLTALHRYAREHRVKKSSEFMAECQKRTTELARQANKRNNWPPKGYRIPRSGECGFQKGVTNRMRLGEERDRERIRKATATRNATIRSERVRLHWGMEQRTKLKLNGTFRSKALVRYNLRKLGYVVARAGQEAIITSTTQRSEHYEKRCREVGIKLVEQ